MKFGEGKEETLQEIANSVDINQIDKILKADQKVVKFGHDNYVVPRKCLFQLSFTASLIEGQPRSFIRNVSVVTVDSSNTPHIMISAITDVDELHGVQENGIYTNSKGINMVV